MIWARLPADAPPIERIYLYVFRVLFMSYVGEFERRSRWSTTSAPRSPRPRFRRRACTPGCCTCAR